MSNDLLTRFPGALELSVDHLSRGDHVEDGEERHQQQVGLGALPPVPGVHGVLRHVRQEQLTLLKPVHSLVIS